MANFRVEICQAQTVIEKRLIWGLSHAGLGVREQAEMPTAHRFPWILILWATTLPAKAGQRSDSGRGATAVAVRQRSRCDSGRGATAVAVRHWGGASRCDPATDVAFPQPFEPRPPWPVAA